MWPYLYQWCFCWLLFLHKIILKQQINISISKIHALKNLKTLDELKISNALSLKMSSVVFDSMVFVFLIKKLRKKMWYKPVSISK